MNQDPRTPRNPPWLGMAISLTMALLAPSELAPCSAETVIGPGSVPAPLVILGDFRIVAGTEIVSHTARLFPDGESLRGDEAVLMDGSAIFDGGDVQGATVTTQPGVINASGGSAISHFSNARPNLIINDGRFRGGSVLVTEPAPSNANFHAAAAIAFGGDDIRSYITIYGGLFEGGSVSMATTPAVSISRAPALQLASNYGATADIYGGQFVGGIKIWGTGYVVGPTRLAFYGSDLEIQPPTANGRVTNAEVTISGRYADGAPFSHDVNVVGGLFVHRGAGYLALDIYDIPEPATGALAAVCLGLAAIRRANNRRPMPAA